MTSLPKIETKWQRFEALSTIELYELLRFRQNIFVVEQRSPYPDLDGLDPSAWHLVARVDGEFVGYLRLVPQARAPVIRIGRVAVAPHLRGRGFGRMLMREALRLHAQNYAGHEIVLGAQAHLARFYAEFGFQMVGQAYDDCGVPHIDMRRRPSL